jgi:16S rRNA (adenine1518-N6/adenine1519-N6)-dimethyltransferase
LQLSATRAAPSLLSQTKALLRQAGLQAKKSLGQHFLVDGAYLKHILAAAELSKDDMVIEVGPGLGVLTRALAERAGRVLAVEKDEDLAGFLRDNLAGFTNLTVVDRDIMKADIAALIGDLQAGTSVRYKVVANLPYYIASPVLRLFLESQMKPERLVVMVQKEVARQISAQPGDMSLLSVGVQLYGQPKIIKYVPARAFYPPPDVDSAILRIAVYPSPRVEVEVESFFVLVRAGFSAARKQIANSLSHGLDLPKEDILSLLARAGVDPQRRAETLSIEEWGRLWQEHHRIVPNL